MMEIIFFSHFSVKSEADEFAINLSGHTGTVGDSLLDLSSPTTSIDGMKFSTVDRDNDA